MSLQRERERVTVCGSRGHTSRTVRAVKNRTSSDRELRQFPAKMSFVRSVCSHHRSSPDPPNDTGPESAGGSMLIRHTDRGMSYRTCIPDSSEDTSSPQTCSCLLERFSCPVFLACLRTDSDTVEPLEPAAAAMKAALGCRCRLAICNRSSAGCTNWVKGQIPRFPRARKLYRMR